MSMLRGGEIFFPEKLSLSHAEDLREIILGITLAHSVCNVICKPDHIFTYTARQYSCLIKAKFGQMVIVSCAYSSWPSMAIMTEEDMV